MTARYKDSTGVDPIRQWLGVYRAKVITTSGTSAKLRVPQVLGAAESAWATPLVAAATPAAGAQVYAMFIGGDITQPVYIVP